MASVASLEKIEIIRSQEFMLSKARLKFLKKMIILGPKTAILGPQVCRILCWSLIFGAQGGPGPQAPPLDPLLERENVWREQIQERCLNFRYFSLSNEMLSRRNFSGDHI